MEPITQHIKLVKWLLLIIVAILLILVFKLFYGEPVNNYPAIKQSIDSFNVREKKREATYLLLEKKITADSIRLSGIESKLDGLPATIDIINKKYTNERNHINSLGVTEQLSFLSGWLSQVDSAQ